MTLYPRDIKEKLEFDRIVASLREECLSAMAREYFDQIEVLTDRNRIQVLLDETEEYRKSIERGEIIPISRFESVTDDVFMLRKEGYVLDLDSIRNIYRTLSIGVDLTHYFNEGERVKLNPLIAEITRHIMVDSKLITEIDRVLDEEGEVRPTASDELMRLSKLIRSREREVDKVFASVLDSYKIKGYLIDSLESIRNGRRVLTVAVEHKRKVAGIIHDESATGKTVFIEPEQVIGLNNDIYNLYAERRHEIYKILRELCNYIRPYADAIVATQHILTKIDTVRAKAKLAYRLFAKKPILQEQPILSLKTAFNPILALRNEQQSITVVPFDLQLYAKNRILILSGPNAGGKSVALKSVGLLQMMIQCGILITADENSTFGIFKSIMVDIGDQQSLDDDLSTYSSHLRNMKTTVEAADASTLVLIDEFGSGTDPKIGGSIAEAILHTLNYKKVFGVITTHYSNLKFYAFKAQGIVNGSMEFDQQHLSPTFRMHVGKPGSSFAFEIAQKIGLDDRIIRYAQEKTGKNEKAIDEMLVSLMADKKEYEDKLASLLEKQDKLDRLIKSYEHINHDLDVRRKKMKLEAKEKSTAQVLEQSKEIEKVIKEIKAKQNLDAARQAAEDLKARQAEALKELEEIKTEVFVTEGITQDERIEVGGYARMRNGSSIGQILSIERGKAELELGFIKVKVPLIDLVATKEPIMIQKRSIHTSIDKPQSDTKIDLREYTKQDALRMLQEFMDRALLHNAYELKIIHGIGTGVMKNEVRKLLKQYKDVKEVWHPEPEQGGEGVTYVKF
jgi:DNA mismatch repair protein MutS2